MDFERNENQKMIAQMIRDFGEKEKTRKSWSNGSFGST